MTPLADGWHLADDIVPGLAPGTTYLRATLPDGRVICAPLGTATDPEIVTEQVTTATEEQLADAARAQLEARVEAMRARDAARDAADAKPMQAAVERVQQILQARGQNPDLALRDALEEQYGQPIEDLRAHQADVRARAWANDLRAANQKDLARWTVDTLADDQHADVLRAYVDGLTKGDRSKLNLILAGRVGPGKTSAAIAVGNLAAAAGLTVRFVKHSTYLAWLRPDGAPDGVTAGQIRERYRRCDVLILDDLGADLHMGEASEFIQRETNELVGDRLTAARATVYTTNLTSAQVEAILGARAASRIGARGYAVRFTGPDRRAPVTW